jgi:hypothetical protein
METISALADACPKATSKSCAGFIEAVRSKAISMTEVAISRHIETELSPWLGAALAMHSSQSRLQPLPTFAVTLFAKAGDTKSVHKVDVSRIPKLIQLLTALHQVVTVCEKAATNALTAHEALVVGAAWGNVMTDVVPALAAPTSTFSAQLCQVHEIVNSLSQRQADAALSAHTALIGDMLANVSWLKFSLNFSQYFL